MLHSDILSGCRYNNSACPVALAVRRAVTDKGFKYSHIHVHTTRIHIIMEGARFQCVVPEPVGKWIKDFDRGLESSDTGTPPFAFTIEAPDLE